jgi:sigma-B regulation protein RsbU (phosphoserine phosphatase)
VSVAKGLPDVAPGLEVTVVSPPDAPKLIDATDEESAFFSSRRLVLLIPLAHAGTCVGLLALGHKLTQREFESEEFEFLSSLASVATPAIENSRVYGELQDLNARLDRKIHELNTLFEIGRRFVGTLEPDEVLRLFSYALMGQLLLTKFLIVLRRPSGDVVQARGIPVSEPYRWQGEAFWEVLASLEEPLRIDPDAHGPLAGYGLLAVVPIRKEDVTHGFVGLGARPSGHGFSDDELAFAGALANQAIVALENAWLIEETIEKRRLEEELAIASSIQSRLFPKRLPDIPCYELAARSTPTRHVGGDYYDAIDLGDGRVLIAIADVSGKGVPAALLMSNVQASLRALCGPDMDLAANAGKISEIIYSNTDFNKYATFFYGILDPEHHLLTYTNAGHNPPILLRASGDLETLDAGGLPVGLMPGSQYDSAAVSFDAGDVLVLYTDGITEAANVGGDEYDTPRLEALVREGATLSAEGLLDRIYDDVFAFSAGTPQGDDITTVIVKRRE